MPSILRSSRPPTRPPTRPPSPSRNRPHNSTLDEFSTDLIAALQASSSAGTSTATATTMPEDANFPREKHDKFHPHLEILVNQDVIVLKGTGVDVEPAVLSGNLVLHLSEPTSIREINLQFRGKARLPATAAEPLSLNSSQLTYVVCNHEWSFLEGAKNHSHTLKAGRHFFPFSVQIGGSLPSSLQTSVLGGASVAYKLRATAVRSGLAHNFQALAPVTILRGFGQEALEYQQTLEIENTWPEKLMYSLMIPHKAWAIRDRVAVVMKFEPIAKGARVISIATSVHESVRIQSRAGSAHESTRAVISMRHEIHNGRPVCVEQPHLGAVRPAVVKSAPVTPAPHTSPPDTPGGGLTNGYFSSSTLPTAQPSSSGNAGPSSSSAAPHSAEASSSTLPQLAGAQDFVLPEDLETSNDELVFTLTLPLLPGITPSHTLDPIHVTHRVRWSILIGNLDGHTSELRCSLPLHVLDDRLYEDARAATSATRRLILGRDTDESGPDSEVDDMELPSYNAHVRDRIANMYVPASATVRVNTSGLSSGTRTPASPRGPGLHLPHAPTTDGTAGPLDWINSELMLSLSQAAAAAAVPAQRDSAHHSPPDSDPTSHRTSRRGSRAPSPERSSSGHHDRTPPTPPSHPMPAPAGTAESTFVHNSNASRSSHGLFSASMKPFTALGNPFSSRSHSHGNLASHFTPHFSSHSHSHHHHNAHHPESGRPSPGHSSSASVGSSTDAAAAAARSYSAVPDYESSSRGFLGGVPPISSMTGLPSYAEAEQSRRISPSGTDSPGTPERRSMGERELGASVSRRDTT